eukprot:gene18124-24564_t
MHQDILPPGIAKLIHVDRTPRSGLDKCFTSIMLSLKTYMHPVFLELLEELILVDKAKEDKEAMHDVEAENAAGALLQMHTFPRGLGKSKLPSSSTSRATTPTKLGKAAVQVNKVGPTLSIKKRGRNRKMATFQTNNGCIPEVLPNVIKPVSTAAEKQLFAELLQLHRKGSKVSYKEIRADFNLRFAQQFSDPKVKELYHSAQPVSQPVSHQVVSQLSVKAPVKYLCTKCLLLRRLVIYKKEHQSACPAECTKEAEATAKRQMGVQRRFSGVDYAIWARNTSKVQLTYSPIAKAAFDK